MKIAVITGTRADYGLLKPTIAALHADDRFDLQLVVSAMHLSEVFGSTESEIDFPVAARVETGADDDEPGSTGRRIGTAVTGFTSCFEQLKPDALVLLGDRYEMLGAALAGASHRLAILHLHGGELTEGSADDAMRHCITKLAHLHFVAARPYGERVCQLGEQPDRVYVGGAAALETIAAAPPIDTGELFAELGVPLERPLVAFTFHPPSLDPDRALADLRSVLDGVEAVGPGTVIVTLPNDDPGNRPVREALLGWAPGHAFPSLGQRRYLGLLAAADAMVGNSSSGLIEAPSFELPVVNVGDRQQGRLAGDNVIHAEPAETGSALAHALDPSFREGLRGMTHPYAGDGPLSQKVLEALAGLAPDVRSKRFLDLPDGAWREGLALS